MRVVSENSESELARRRAADVVKCSVRELAANLMRVTRGAGKAYEIGRQAQSLVDALVEYHKVVGHWPPSGELGGFLRIDNDPEVLARVPDDQLAEIYAKQSLVRGALQIAASRLLDQGTQESAGDHEMYGAVRELEEVRAERRRKWATSSTAPRIKSQTRPTKRPRNPPSS